MHGCINKHSDITTTDDIGFLLWLCCFNSIFKFINAHSTILTQRSWFILMSLHSPVWPLVQVECPCLTTSWRTRLCFEVVTFVRMHRIPLGSSPIKKETQLYETRDKAWDGNSVLECNGVLLSVTLLTVYLLCCTLDSEENEGVPSVTEWINE